MARFKIIKGHVNSFTRKVDTEVIAEFDDEKEAYKFADYCRFKVYKCDRITDDVWVEDSEAKPAPKATAKIGKKYFTHSVFGKGEILEINGDIASVKFADGVKRLSLSFFKNK